MEKSTWLSITKDLILSMGVKVADYMGPQRQVFINWKFYISTQSNIQYLSHK